MTHLIKSAIKFAVLRLLEPLALLLIEAQIGAGEFHQLAKQAYVRAARRAGAKTRENYSQIAVITGLTRAEVTRIAKALDAAPDPAHPLQELERSLGATRAERVIRGWWSDPEFLDERGRPAHLPLRGAHGSFAALVLRYAGGPRSLAVIREMLKAKAVRRLPDNKVEVLSRTVATVNWDEQGVQAVGERVRDLLHVLVYNLQHPSSPRYVRFVVNAAVDPKFVPLLLRDLTRQAENFGDGFHDALTDPHRTIRPGTEPKEAHRLGFGLYVIDEATVVAPEVSRPRSKKRG